MTAKALSLPFPELAGPSVVVHHGDCLDVLRSMADASVDAVVTDPPYELGFMGRKWDASGIAYSVDLWREVLRVLKPGGHLLAFGGTRTYHRMTCAIEDAGFEIRDTIAWMYGQGFPKSHNLDGAHKGWGTALKPAHEPVTVARKALVGTVAANVQAYGTGAINVDGCRVEHSGPPIPVFAANKKDRWLGRDGVKIVATGETRTDGRWPANVVLDEDAAVCLDAQTEGVVHSAGAARAEPGGGTYDGSTGIGFAKSGSGIGVGLKGFRIGDSGGASRFFYCAKASRAERNAGCEALPAKAASERNAFAGLPDPRMATTQARNPSANHHPTVKPLALMRWLVRLVTPPGGTVLDPFAGSGTTLVAAKAEGFHAVGIEREAEYVEIIKARVGA